MTFARQETVDPRKQGTYHCWSRCVRRAFLCGFDALTGKNFDHRKAWVEERMAKLASLFAIDVLAYAIMCNHEHLALRNYPSVAWAWTSEEVARRWRLLFPKRRDENGNPEEPNEAELQAITSDPERVEQLRERLCDISWFMRCLNENIARRANEEDAVTGRFWEGRFKCTRLDDVAAVFSCMVYIDLNPIRAGTAQTPEQSEFTSAFTRILTEKINGRKERAAELKRTWLCPVEKIFSTHDRPTITLAEYLTVLDETGRQLAKGKRGFIPGHLGPILERLSIQPKNWISTSSKFGRMFPRVAASPEKMRLAAEACGRRWFKGVSVAASCF